MESQMDKQKRVKSPESADALRARASERRQEPDETDEISAGHPPPAVEPTGNKPSALHPAPDASVAIVELPNLADAISVLDAMLKSASVRLIAWEKKLGGRLVTLIVAGGAADAREAAEAARQCPGVEIAAWTVIPNPHPETWKMIGKSAAKLKN